ncbi:MAG TPA: PAS domain S-box protein [Methylomirabilota bacterium]|nr:PAS domain S-box protein [Methylomirabilota bacterium]
MPTKPFDGRTATEWAQALFELSDDAQVICTLDGRVQHFNRRAEFFFEITSSSQDISLSNFFSEPVAKSLRAMLQSPIKTQEQLKCVSFFAGGTLRSMVDLHLSRLDAEHWVVTLRDATRRYRMESHAQRLAQALDATPDVFILADADYRITYVNAGFHTVTGHTIEETLGRSADFLRAPFEKEKIASYTQAIEHGLDWVGELQNVRKDGAVYTVEATISPIYDTQDQLLGYVSCERDVSLKKRMQEELRQERNYARSILNSLDSAVYTLNRNFQILQVNEAARRMGLTHGLLHFPQPPEAGMSLLEFVAEPIKRTELRLVFEQALSDGKVAEMCSASTDGKHWHIKISPWKHEEKIVGLLYQVTDQSSINELRNSLYQGEKLRTIGALAAGIAHDFNNLLLVIQGNLSLLENEDEDPATRDKHLKNIEQAAAQAAEITQQMLAFTRASKQKIAVFDLNSTVLEVSRLLTRSIKPNVEVQFDLTQEAAKVKMDPSRAHQLLLNLCVNAQDAMPSGGRVTVRTELVRLTRQQAVKTDYAPDSWFIRCSVADTGTGIPHEILDRIFDPFFTTKDPGKGTGLGLSIVHGVVSEAGGFIEVDTRLGEGTVFNVYFPSVDSDLTIAKNETYAAAAKGTGRILVVDDIELVREFTSDFLQAAGFEVTAAGNADEALEALQSDSFDVVFTDFNMPGLTGLELVEQIRAQWPHVKAIVTSGFFEEQVQTRLVEDLQAMTLSKPYTVKEATEAVLALLSTKE